MLGQEIDVTELVKSGKFKPNYCQGGIDKLIDTRPTTVDLQYEIELQNQLLVWVDKYNQMLKNKNEDTVVFKFDNLYAKTKYQYSYIINSVDKPIAVYRTDIKTKDNKDLRLFIRMEQNKFFENDYKANGWVINECDSLNSIVTNLP